MSLGQKIFHYLNHPVQWVRLVGVVVAIDEFYGRVCYTIDDSSGRTIECVCKAPPKPEVPLPKEHDPFSKQKPVEFAKVDDPMISEDGPRLKGIDVGHVVKVKGLVTTFRDVRQIEMKRIHVVPDTSAEVGEWSARTAFMKNILSKPWVVTEDQEKACLKKANEETFRDEERKRRKIKKGETEDERKLRKRREKLLKRELEKRSEQDERMERERWYRAEKQRMDRKRAEKAKKKSWL